MKSGAIVLCGGRGRRMGVPKAILPFGPEMMLHRVVRLVGQFAERTVVVAAPGQSLPGLPDEVLVAHDRHEGRGPLEGLHAGLSALPSDSELVYVTGCDVPLLVPAVALKLFDLIGDHDAAVPREGELSHPLSAVYRRRVVDAIGRMLSANRLKVTDLLENVRTLHVPVSELREVDPGLNTLRNLNTPSEYRAATSEAGYEIPAEIDERLDGRDVS